MSKWAVLKDADRIGWIVVHPGDVFRTGFGLLDCWDVHSYHSTWAEALQEADRMTRSVTVTLPADPDREMPAMTIMTHSEPEGAWIERTYWVPGGQDITLPDALREPVALALLAHARKEGT